MSSACHSPKSSVASACLKPLAAAKTGLLAPFLSLIACIEPIPRAEPPLGVPPFVSYTECWKAYMCFERADGNFDKAIACRAEYPEVADQAGEARYQAVIFGENAKQIACFLGGFG